MYHTIPRRAANGPSQQPIHQVVKGFKPMVAAGVIEANIRSACARGLPALDKPRHSGPAVCVGGGPSLLEYLDHVASWQAQGAFTVAAKGAWRTLKREGLKVDYVCMIDPDPTQEAYIKDLPIDTVAVMASACAPEVFDRLGAQGNEVLLCHVPMMDKKPGLFPPGSFGLAGGPAVGSRQLRAAMRLGADALKLFGYDNCVPSHFDGSGELVPSFAATHVYTLANRAQRAMRVDCADRQFLATPVMAGECHDICMWHMGGKSPPITVYGDGMLAHQFSKIIKFADANPRERAALEHLYRAPATVNRSAA